MRVTRTDSSQIVLHDPNLRGDTLVGTGRKGVEVRIPLDSVQQVETRRFSVANTYALVVGTAAAALLGLIIYFSHTQVD